MPRLPVERLSATDIELISCALNAAVDGPFFDDEEFHTLMGVDRTEMRQVMADWPQQTVNNEAFHSAVCNSLLNLWGYPHHMDAELDARIPGGKTAIKPVLDRLREVGA